MITWITIILWMNVCAIVRSVQRSVEVDLLECLGGLLAVASATVPAIYATGWLLLPAYGVGVP